MLGGTGISIFTRGVVFMAIYYYVTYNFSTLFLHAVYNISQF
nr:MAG TPA: hypothetical protein [Caudoviricetes sp.]